MADEGYTFEQTKARLEEILLEVKKKDTSLEKSIELLEEGVRLANRCNELIDRTSWDDAPGESAESETGDAEARRAPSEPSADADSPRAESSASEADAEVVVIDEVEVIETAEGDIIVEETVEVVEAEAEGGKIADDERS